MSAKSPEDNECTDRLVDTGLTTSSYESYFSSNLSDFYTFNNSTQYMHTYKYTHWTSCIIEIRNWMARNQLKLNEEKTQIIWLGTRQQLDKITTDSAERHRAIFICGQRP